MATAMGFLLSFTLLGWPPSVAAQPPLTAQDIGKKIAERLTTRDESFKVKMKIIEADGSSKDREMSIQRLSPQKKEHYLLVRMQKPQDLKGTALLATLKEGKEEKWLYLPSSKQTRRLSGDSGGSGGILGSELSTEDFDFNADRSTENVLKREVEIKGKKYYVIESKVDTTSEIYSRIVSYVTVDGFLPVKSECFDKKGQLYKVIDLSNYKTLPGGKFRAERIQIKNVQNKRSTEITLSEIKVNKGLTQSRFSPKALSEDF